MIKRQLDVVARIRLPVALASLVHGLAVSVALDADVVLEHLVRARRQLRLVECSRDAEDVRKKGRAVSDFARELCVRHCASGAPDLELDLILIDVSLVSLIQEHAVGFVRVRPSVGELVAAGNLVQHFAVSELVRSAAPLELLRNLDLLLDCRLVEPSALRVCLLKNFLVQVILLELIHPSRIGVAVLPDELDQLGDVVGAEVEGVAHGLRHEVLAHEDVDFVRQQHALRRLLPWPRGS
mmetsp:Transcript_32446/g.71139  ORF Transcript_32446/g.71139 Transcript_32446/m.71139 type:complete len:239 (-) Transcript_32446:461-1177(-)